MKKIIVVLISAITLSVLLQSCAPGRGRGCPTTNPRYFKP